MAKKDRAGDDSGRGRGRDDTQPDDRTTTAADTGRRGADDPAGDDRRGRGADDPPGDDRGGRGADDPPGDDRGGDAARLRGGDGSDSLSGSAADDRLRGDDGDDTLDGGAGADTLDGDDGADRLIGGPGADVFKVGDGGRALAGLDRIVDFTHGEDKLVFDDDGLTATAANFATGAAADYDAALAAANARMAAGADYVAVQVGADVIVFATELGEHHVESAVILVGRTLADISAGDIG
ncbi:MAG: hypothetical protein JNK30_09970 [Phenylobacterium sp.]|uniref:hypothetical protein n=1 Tax=Phenylobacterium sp. TaxID=1871053 RepID=UPI001A3796A6|nr:hypothetical protein [Phenylobacterium sp.]MBL8771695.1 hypothetical protein [Phenylobacterium sp.]